MDDYRKLPVERDEERLRPLGQTPTVSDYITAAYTPQLRGTAIPGCHLRRSRRRILAQPESS